MTLTAEQPALPKVDPQKLVDEQLFARLVARIDTEYNTGLPDAERIMSQALAFLKACANAGQPLSPSPHVDAGWHTFILYTKEYAAFCDRIAGRFIHHAPEDIPSAVNEPAEHVRARTLTAIERAGFTIDPELWADDGHCSNGGGPGGPGGGCHQGCHDSA